MKHQQYTCRHGGNAWRDPSRSSEVGPSPASSLKHHTQAPLPVTSSGGFTLVEIMVVVVIIGLLAIMAIPAFQRSRIASQNARLVNDFRQFKAAFDTYALENGSWPDDENPGVMPDVMEGYIAESKFEDTTHVQGNWDWEAGVFGITAAISLRGSNAKAAQMAEVDASLDDGNLATGNFRIIDGDTYGYILEE